jgi:hypothetical protein
MKKLLIRAVRSQLSKALAVRLRTAGGNSDEVNGFIFSAACVFQEVRDFLLSLELRSCPAEHSKNRKNW